MNCRIDDAAYAISAALTVVVAPGEVHEIINSGAAELVELVVTYFGVVVEP